MSFVDELEKNDVFDEGESRMTEIIDFEGAIKDKLRKDNNSYTGHDEDPEDNVFHASWMGYCKRQVYLSKTGLKYHDDKTLGIFRAGSRVHSFMEDEVFEELPRHLVFEKPIRPLEIDGVKFVGTADCIDMENGVIYDFKSRGGWYRFNPPTQRHLDQLHIYMKATGIHEAQVVYISKKDFEVRTWPEDGTFEFDEERFQELVEKAKTVMDLIEEHGVAESEDELDDIVEKCDSFICKKEGLVFDE